VLILGRIQGYSRDFHLQAGLAPCLSDGQGAPCPFALFPICREFRFSCSLPLPNAGAHKKNHFSIHFPCVWCDRYHSGRFCTSNPDLVCAVIQDCAVRRLRVRRGNKAIPAISGLVASSFIPPFAVSEVWDM